MNRTIAVAVLLGALSACDGGLSGEYGSVNDFTGKWHTRYTFKGDQVEIDLMGNIQVGSYKVEDGKVYITLGGQTQALRINDQGCIDGGMLLGVACKKT